ncbi:26S proteasome non-ATPase regulatory subunit 4 [Tanacetum coccineum]
MAAEVTVICMDTSSWMGDNKSPRFLAQADAIELYCKEKIDFHPENCVGILAMGHNVYNLVRPTRDLQKIMSSIYDALRRADEFLGNHMMYKRIVVFAGGPVYWFKGQLIGIGTNLKEKGVAVDVINFGDKDGPRSGYCEDWRDVFKDNRIPGESKKGSLEALVTAANHNDNSHILHVPEDQFSLREHLSSRTLWETSAALESDQTMAKQSQIDALLIKENVNAGNGRAGKALSSIPSLFIQSFVCDSLTSQRSYLGFSELALSQVVYHRKRPHFHIQIGGPYQDCSR